MSGNPHDPLELGALGMAGRRTFGGMAQTIPQRAQSPDRAIKLFRLGGQSSAVDGRAAVGNDHLGNLLEREARGSPKRDERQRFEHARIEKAPQPGPADRADEPFLLILADRRGRHAGAIDDL